MSDTHVKEPKAILSATPEAIGQLRKLMANEPPEVEGVRVAVRGGGCSGLSYVLEFSKQNEGDKVHEQDGLQFFMDRKSAIYLKGIVLDFREGLNGKGFVFTNPNASSTCGCGESFSV